MLDRNVLENDFYARLDKKADMSQAREVLGILEGILVEYENGFLDAGSSFNRATNTLKKYFDSSNRDQ